MTGEGVWLDFAGLLLDSVLRPVHRRGRHAVRHRRRRRGADPPPAGPDGQRRPRPAGRAAAGALLSLRRAHRLRAATATAAERALGVVKALWPARVPRFIGWGLAVAEARAGRAARGRRRRAGRATRRTAELHRTALLGTAPGAVVAVGRAGRRRVPAARRTGRCWAGARRRTSAVTSCATPRRRTRRGCGRRWGDGGRRGHPQRPCRRSPGAHRARARRGARGRRGGRAVSGYAGVGTARSCRAREQKLPFGGNGRATPSGAGNARTGVRGRSPHPGGQSRGAPTAGSAGRRPAAREPQRPRSARDVTARSTIASSCAWCAPRQYTRPQAVHWAKTSYERWVPSSSWSGDRSLSAGPQAGRCRRCSGSRARGRGRSGPERRAVARRAVAVDVRARPRARGGAAGRGPGRA